MFQHLLSFIRHLIYLINMEYNGVVVAMILIIPCLYGQCTRKLALEIRAIVVRTATTLEN